MVMAFIRIRISVLARIAAAKGGRTLRRQSEHLDAVRMQHAVVLLDIIAAHDMLGELKPWA